MKSNDILCHFFLFSTNFYRYIKYTTLLDSDELLIEADYNKLKQVFINVFKNCIEAKGNSKLLVVIKTLEGKDYYVVTITDSIA